jgi:ABC-2 type transport system permease protein
VQDYGVYLLTSLVLWTYFAEATNGAAASLLRHQGLLRKLRFPRIAIPLSVVLKSLFNLGLNLLAVAVFVALSGVDPRITWLELPLLLALLALFATGISMLLSALFVRFRDVAQIWAVMLQMLFFSSAVLYVVTDFPEGLQQYAAANPLAMIFTEMRHALIDPAAPSAGDVAGGWPALGVPLGVIALTLALGFWVFHRESPQMAENL